MSFVPAVGARALRGLREEPLAAAPRLSAPRRRVACAGTMARAGSDISIVDQGWNDIEPVPEESRHALERQRPRALVDVGASALSRPRWLPRSAPIGHVAIMVCNAGIGGAALLERGLRRSRPGVKSSG